MAEEVKKTIEKDPFLGPKHIGYCWSQTPLEGMTYKDFVKYAQFQLCYATKRLMRDPIWDTYTNEEILAEFFAHQFEQKPDTVREFETRLNKGAYIDFNTWADLEIKRTQEEQDKKLKELEDRVSFVPDQVMGEG